MLVYAPLFFVLLSCLSMKGFANHVKPFDWVVVAVFKNETMILGSWVQHYINEGVDHLYLIDNGSKDDYMNVLYNFPQQMITVIRDSSPPKVGLQEALMHKYLNSIVVKETNWVLVVDVDEYFYPSDPTMCTGQLLSSYDSSVHRIWLPWLIFGSNGHLEQPKEGIVGGFTNRSVLNLTLNAQALGYGKGLVRVKHRLALGVHMSGNTENAIHYSNGTLVHHGANYENITLTEDFIHTQPFRLNHYMFQSRDYYQRVKSIRGGGQSGRTFKYSMAFFDQYGLRYNAKEDHELAYRQKVLDNKCVSKHALDRAE